MNNNVVNFDFPSFFNDKLKERGYTLKRVAELSGIAVRHLENMSEGKFAALPSAPYVHGYLVKLGELLDFDGEMWWKYLEETGSLNRSGPADELPKNRFARRPLNRYAWLIILVLGLAVYLVIQSPRILGKPSLVVEHPREESLSVNIGSVTMYGEALADTLMINGESVPILEGGRWEKTITLTPGLNTIELKAKKFLGRETVVERKIYYEPLRGEEPPPASTSTGQ